MVFEEAGRKISRAMGNMRSRVVDYTMERGQNALVHDTERRKAVMDEVNKETIAKTLRPEMFRTKEMREELPRIRERLLHSPEGLIDWLDGFLDPFRKKAVPDVMMEYVGIKVDELPEESKRLLNLCSLIADLGVFVGYMDVISTAVSLTLLRKVGDFVDRVVRVSGMNLVAGYGLGTALGTAITPGLRYAINRQFMPVVPELRDLQMARSRWILAPEDLPRWLPQHGINPSTVYGTGQEWPTIESLWKNPFEPKKWEWERINRWGKMYERLSQAPAGYFLLSMASRSGFYIEEIYRKALEDSDYGPLPMAIALAAFRKAFLRRHITKFEDAAIEDYLTGEIKFDQFKDRLRALEYSEDMIEIISGFYRDRQYRARRRATLTMLKARFKAGRLDEGAFKHELRRMRYPPEEIDWIVKDTKAEMAPDRELTKAEILAAYRLKFKPRIWAAERLGRIMADPDDANLLLDMNAPKGD